MKKKWLYLLLIILTIAIFYNVVYVDELDKSKTNLSEIEDELLDPYHIENAAVNQEKSSNREEKNNESTLTGKELLIETLFSSISANDTDVFLQLFNTEVISKDLFAYENTDKLEVAMELIKEISRDGKLVEISYETKKGFLKEKSDEMRVNLYYKDDKKVSITLLLESQSSYHDNEPDYYLISTPPSEMIKTVKASI